MRSFTIFAILAVLALLVSSAAFAKPPVKNSDALGSNAGWDMGGMGEPTAISDFNKAPGNDECVKPDKNKKKKSGSQKIESSKCKKIAGKTKKPVEPSAPDSDKTPEKVNASGAK